MNRVFSLVLDGSWCKTKLLLKENESLFLGRKDLIEEDKLVSRQHIQFNLEKKSNKSVLYATLCGLNPSTLTKSGEMELIEMKKGQKYSVFNGDKVNCIPGKYGVTGNKLNLSKTAINIVVNEEKGINNIPIDLTSDSEIKEPDSKKYKKSPDSKNSLNSKSVSEILEILQDAKEDQVKEALILCDGNVEHAIELLLNEKPKSDSKQEKEEISNKISRMPELPSCEYVYRLNYIHGLADEANIGAISLHQLFDCDMKEAILTTYKVDIFWLFNKHPKLRKIPVHICHGESQPQTILPEWKNLTMSAPKMPLSYGVNHGKIFVLFLAGDIVRVIVSTANLLSIDYHRKTQGIWYQDFPVKSGKKESCDFEDTLCDYLERLGLAKTAISLQKYDFSSAKAILITSVPGTFYTHKLHSYGHMKIRKILEGITLPDRMKEAPLWCQFSSLGMLGEDWIYEEFLKSFTANKYDSSSKGDEMDSKKRKLSLSAKRINFVWPTVDFVRGSIDGYGSGGSLCLNNKNIREFISTSLHKYQPNQKGRENIPPHIKSYTRYTEEGELSWVCLTSANMSKGAWGALQKGGSQFMIRNFEVGVIFLPSNFKKDDVVPRFVAGSAPFRFENVSISFPLPSKIPPAKYTDSDEPWSWDKSHSKQDIFGIKYEV